MNVLQIGKPAPVSPTKDRRKDMGSPLRNPGSPMRKNSRSERRYYSLQSARFQTIYTNNITAAKLYSVKEFMPFKGCITNSTLYTRGFSLNRVEWIFESPSAFSLSCKTCMKSSCLSNKDGKCTANWLFILYAAYFGSKLHQISLPLADYCHH